MDDEDWIIIDENGYNDPAIPKNFISRYHYYYLGIPAKLNYYFLNGKIKLYASAGVAADFFVAGKSKTVAEFKDRIEKETRNLDGDFNQVNIVGLAGLGLETDVLSKLTLRFEPAFRYSFTPIIEPDMKAYYYSAGMNIVLFCNL